MACRLLRLHDHYIFLLYSVCIVMMTITYSNDSIIGQQFDKNGVRQQWWTDESMTAFRERHSCFVDEYSQFTNEGAQVYSYMYTLSYAYFILESLIR